MEDSTGASILERVRAVGLGRVVPPARLACPTRFVMEGRHAVDGIGVNTVNVLTGVEGRIA